MVTFNTHLPKVNDVGYMFIICASLKSFVADCPSLKVIDSMFKNCTSLKHFRSSMPLLYDAPGMFHMCILDSDSVQFLLYMLQPNAGLRRITIGCGCSADDDSKDAYAQEIGYESFTALNDAFTAKGWTATWQFNGPAAANYSLRGPRSEQVKVFAKIAKADEDVASYTDGEKFYNLDWGHVVNDDSYEEFESFETALEHFNLTEINRTIGDE